MQRQIHRRVAVVEAEDRNGIAQHRVMCIVHSNGIGKNMEKKKKKPTLLYFLEIDVRVHAYSKLPAVWMVIQIRKRDLQVEYSIIVRSFKLARSHS